MNPLEALKAERSSAANTVVIGVEETDTAEDFDLRGQCWKKNS
ncbi:MAG: hypothetical protein ACLGHS_09890 [Actinomycetes bacterium]